jgi:hypothetical protein
VGKKGMAIAFLLTFLQGYYWLQIFFAAAARLETFIDPSAIGKLSSLYQEVKVGYA